MWKLELIAVDGSGETNVLIILYKTTLDYCHKSGGYFLHESIYC